MAITQHQANKAYALSARHVAESNPSELRNKYAAVLYNPEQGSLRIVDSCQDLDELVVRNHGQHGGEIISYVFVPGARKRLAPVSGESR